MSQERIDAMVKRVGALGDIHVCSARGAFTLYMTGSGLSGMKTVAEISKAAIGLFGHEYPILDVMKNDDEFLLIVMSKKQNQ